MRRVLPFIALAIWGLVAWQAVGSLILLWPSATEVSIGIDYRLYMTVARMWLETGEMYWPHQLAGPYHAVSADASPYGGDSFYPPNALYLLVPASFLPAPLWWIIPFALTAAALWRLRPSALAWIVMGVLAVTPHAQAPIFYGNPVIWIVPAVAWGFILGWPAVVVLIKPTVAPFVLAGLARPRALLWAIAIGGLLCLPFGELWVDWLKVVLYSDVPFTYSVVQYVLLLIPVVAWLGRRTPATTPPVGAEPRSVPLAHRVQGLGRRRMSRPGRGGEDGHVGPQLERPGTEARLDHAGD